MKKLKGWENQWYQTNIDRIKAEVKNYTEPVFGYEWAGNVLVWSRLSGRMQFRIRPMADLLRKEVEEDATNQ